MNQKFPDGPIRLARLRLLARDVEAQRQFYKDLFGLSITADSKHTVTVRSSGTSATEIEFVEAESEPTQHGVPGHQNPYYHFAFNIPENRINEALEWTKARVPIVKNSAGKEIVFFESWNAHALYFFDPAGNIVEFIARHTMPNASAKPFGPDSILEASEIGLVVPDVAATVKHIERDLGATPYRTPSAEFAAIGDERGLFIIVRKGRKWFMAEHLGAEVYETGVTLGGAAGLPYEIRGV